MTPEQRAAKVVVEVREHGLFNHVTDETWMRYIASAIEQATEGYISIPDANEFDDVVRLLGIEDSHLSPVEAVEELMGQAKAWKEACRKAGVCMSCAIGAPETFGCTDCLNTGWNSGAPAGYVSEENVCRLYQENGALRKVNYCVREYQDFLRRSTNVGPVTNGPHKEARLLRAMYEAAANAHAVMEGQPEGCR